MDFLLTKHAIHVMQERSISLEWVKKVIRNPIYIEECLDAPDLERRYGMIAERDHRVVRVVVNKASLPLLVVSVYFGRSKKGKYETPR